MKTSFLYQLSILIVFVLGVALSINRLMKNYMTYIVVCMMLLSCSTKEEQEIDKEISSGVVLVQNQSYYEVQLSNGNSLFFSYFDPEKGTIKGLVANKDSVQVSTSYGTGFFISEDGKIATNAHVVSNVISDKDVSKSMSRIFDTVKDLLIVQYKKIQDKYEELQKVCEYARYSDEVTYDEYSRLCDYRDELGDEVRTYVALYNGMDKLRANESNIIYHNEVSIAYNNTFVTKTSDFVSCVVNKTDKEHDLAILQLKDKKTPLDKFVFNISKYDPLETYSLSDKLTKILGTDKNSKLLMVSFNLGPTLSLTKEGVKSQFNGGTISQRTEDRLMYSIPALHGSSGSPVVNLKGEVVAVNYAGLEKAPNFNYGIRERHLRNLINKYR